MTMPQSHLLIIAFKYLSILSTYFNIYFIIMQISSRTYYHYRTRFHSCIRSTGFVRLCCSLAQGKTVPAFVLQVFLVRDHGDQLCCCLAKRKNHSNRGQPGSSNRLVSEASTISPTSEARLCYYGMLRPHSLRQGDFPVYNVILIVDNRFFFNRFQESSCRIFKELNNYKIPVYSVYSCK